MPSDFDTLWEATGSPVVSEFFGEPVRYTDLSGATVTDDYCFVDFIESGYEVDAGIRQLTPPEGSDRGVNYKSRRAFGFRKSVVPSIQLRGLVKVVGEGAQADVWTVNRLIGSESDRVYVECEKTDAHERSRPNLRAKG